MLKHFHHLAPFLKQRKWHYILGILVLVIVDGLQLITPQILKRFTDAVTTQSLEATDLWVYPALILVVASGIALARYLWRMLIIVSSREIEFWLRNRLFSHLETLSQSFYHRNKTGDLMAHATNDLNAIRMAFGPGIVMIVDAVFLTLMTIGIMMVNLDLKLTLLALIPMPVITLTVGFFGKLIQQRFKHVQESFSSLSEKVQESFSGIRVIKSFSQEKLDLDDFDSYNIAFLKSNMSLIRLSGVLHPMITLISTTSLLIILSYGTTLVIDGRISLGDFVAFISYIEILTWPMMAIGFVVNVLQRGIASMKRINILLDSETDILDAGAHPLRDYTIELDRLSYRYSPQSPYVLKDISVTIPQGSSLGILGRTGSGKTTLVNLLLRLYQVDPGMIRIGGRDILDYDHHDIRRLFGVVPQDNFLFSTTIRDNIGFEEKSPDPEKVIQTARSSQIEDEIRDLPDGFETLLGERGVNLSGGQKQRTSIARALYRDPRILVLDDALSAVDTDTEERILSYLKEELAQRTSIVISHRISTLKHLDHILVLDEGQMVAYGTHESLLAQEGLYREIHDKQWLEAQIEEVK